MCGNIYVEGREHYYATFFITGDLQLVQLLPGSLQNNLWCSPSVSLTLDGGANKPYLSSHLSAAGHHGTLMVQLLGGVGGVQLIRPFKNVLKCFAESRKEEF